MDITFFIKNESDSAHNIKLFDAHYVLNISTDTAPLLFNDGEVSVEIKHNPLRNTLITYREFLCHLIHMPVYVFFNCSKKIDITERDNCGTIYRDGPKYIKGVKEGEWCFTGYTTVFATLAKAESISIKLTPLTHLNQSKRFSNSM